MTPLILPVKSLRFQPTFETLRCDELGLFRPPLDCKQRRSETIAGISISTQIEECHPASDSVRFWPQRRPGAAFRGVGDCGRICRCAVVRTQPPQGENLRARTRDRQPALGFNNLSNHRCLNPGFRFSMKALIPSFWSSVANSEWNRRRSNSTPSVRVDS